MENGTTWTLKLERAKLRIHHTIAQLSIEHPPGFPVRKRRKQPNHATQRNQHEAAADAPASPSQTARPQTKSGGCESVFGNYEFSVEYVLIFLVLWWELDIGMDWELEIG